MSLAIKTHYKEEDTQVTALWPAMASFSCGSPILKNVLFSVCLKKIVYEQQVCKLVVEIQLGYNASIKKMILFTFKTVQFIPIQKYVKLKATTGTIKRRQYKKLLFFQNQNSAQRVPRKLCSKAQMFNNSHILKPTLFLN